MRTIVVVLLVAWTVAGCGGGGGGSGDPADSAAEVAGTDSPADAPPEVGPDVVPDGTAETVPDGSVDVPPGLPEGCCDLEGDCGEGETCFHSEGMEHGICLPVPADGSGACWTGADCPDGECRDPAICACGANCVSEAGWCLPAGCCAGDGDCDGGDVCIVTSGSLGVCKPELVAGYACWRDADCDFGLCEGASVCPCGAACDMEDVPGLCTAPPTGCCTQDPDCQDLKTCVFTGGFPGVCKSAPLEGQCWSAADCAVGECVGPQVCPCDADCDAEDEPGWCTSEYPGCCQVDGDCVGGSSCVVAGDAMGVCRPDPGAGACWEDGDCPGGYCAGADLCPCGIDCPQASPGLCSDLPAGCCLSAAGCAAGQVCASPKWDDGPGICKDPVAGGCWSDADCDGGACAGVTLCPCGDDCLVPDEAGTC